MASRLCHFRWAIARAAAPRLWARMAGRALSSTHGTLGQDKPNKKSGGGGWERSSCSRKRMREAEAGRTGHAQCVGEHGEEYGLRGRAQAWEHRAARILPVRRARPCAVRGERPILPLRRGPSELRARLLPRRERKRSQAHATVVPQLRPNHAHARLGPAFWNSTTANDLEKETPTC